MCFFFHILTCEELHGPAELVDRVRLHEAEEEECDDADAQDDDGEAHEDGGGAEG